VGYSVAWIAVQTTDHTALFTEAGIRSTNEPDEAFESPIAGAALTNGWYLLVGQGCNHRLIGRALLSSLSARWPCVACSVEEHVMVSSASLWNAGHEVWSVSHDAQRGRFDLTAAGNLPAAFDELRRRTIREQEAEGGEKAGVDVIFEIPLLLAKEITGFKHDEEPTCLAHPAVAFVDEGSPPKGPWWKIW